MWNRLKSRIGGRGIAVGAIALVALIAGVALLLGSGDEETTPVPQSDVSGEARAETTSKKPEDEDRKAGDKQPSAPDDEPEAPAPSGVPEEFADFQDCVRENGGKPLDLSDGSDAQAALEDYSEAEIEQLRQARAACVDELPGEIRERAEQVAASPFRSCVLAEQETGKDLVEAAEACEDELPEGSGELPPAFGGDGERPFGEDRPGGGGPGGD